MKVDSEIIRPSGITQFNFYSEQIPDKGVVAYLGLFENYFSFFVFKDAKLSFYQGIKKGFASEHYLDDIDMCFEFYINENPDDEIERLYIGGYVGNRKDIQDIFIAFGNMDVNILDEALIVRKGKDLILSGIEGELAVFASAIGAAQGLVQ